MGLGKFLEFAFDIVNTWDKCNKDKSFREKIDNAKGFYNNVRDTFGNKSGGTSIYEKDFITKHSSLSTKELRHLYYNSVSSPEKDMLAKLLDSRGEPY